MADYNKQTVAQLRQLLKERGIPSTGLQRKAQIIEKLQEADQEGDEDPPPTSSNDAPPDPVEQVQQESVSENSATTQDAPGPNLADAGEPTEKPEEDSATAPSVPVVTVDANRETVSHIDSDVPPPDHLKTIASTAEEATVSEGADGPQPGEIFKAPPADPEDVVGPKITEPTDAELEVHATGETLKDDLPDAPGPAAEALRYEDKNNADSTKPSSPAPSEKLTIEKQELLPIPEGSTAETSRLNTEELEADSRKRKRRSNSPDLPSQDIRAKKARPSQEPVPEVYLKEDNDVVMEQTRPNETEPPSSTDTRRDKREKSDRYKNLVGQVTEDASLDALQDDRPTAPALHHATPALYIRDFMRPLRPEPLRAHLVSLASPPSSSPDPSLLKAMFLDPMKTHALVLFSNTTAASRVRASLHGSIWPPEGNRKELWVDFVPEDKVEEWIKEEEDAITAEKEARASGRYIAAKRFEVVYPENDDGSIAAVFQEVGASVPMTAQQAQRGSIDARRPSQNLPPVANKDTRHDIEQSFKTLDQLFSSTKAKPNLYYLPVSEETTDRRLEELDAETSRDWAPGEIRKGRGIKTEVKYRYTFDEDDRIVEIGEDYGPWVEPFRGRGGFRGRARGGRGGQWRG